MMPLTIFLLIDFILITFLIRVNKNYYIFTFFSITLFFLIFLFLIDEYLNLDFYVLPIYLNFSILIFFNTLYLFFFSAIAKSISLDFLYYISTNNTFLKEKNLYHQKLLPNFESRFNILIDSELIYKKENGSYVITKKGFKVVKYINFFRFIFNFGNRKLYFKT